MSFEGKRVAVTGAAGNLGQAVAAAFAAEGADLVLIDRIEAQIDTAGAGSVGSVVVDLTSSEATVSTFADLGPLDVLCNIAGGFDMGTPVHETTV